MIDPSRITKYGQTTFELEETIVWWILAAGKDGMRAARCAEAIFTEIGSSNRQPFCDLKAYTNLSHLLLANLLARHKTGAQNLKAKTIIKLINANLDLHTCTRDQLVGIWGIGMKTATCFILHSREGTEMAGIDTHYKKFLVDHGISAPKSLTKNAYLTLEAEGIKIARQRGISCAELDLSVWNVYRTGGKLL